MIAVGFAIGWACVSMVLSIAAVCIAGWAIVEVVAYKRSTHQVQYVSAQDILKEQLDDKEINKVFSDELGRKMQAEFGEERIPE